MSTNWKKGDIVSCNGNGAMKEKFIGQIQKVYENSVFVSILEYQACDEENAFDLIFKTVIRKDAIQKYLNHKLPQARKTQDVVGNLIYLNNY